MDNRLFDNLSGMQHDYHAPFFWHHGESEELLENEIDAIYNSNIYTVCFESRRHPDFCGPKYWEDMRFVLSECKKRGMHAWILDDCHCPSGNANNSFADNKHDEELPWEIKEKHLDVCGPIVDGSIVAKRWLTHESDELIGIVACKHILESDIFTDEFVNLTGNMHDGMVYFTLGEGVWRIFFLIKTRENVKPFCDKLSSVSTDVYIKEVYEPHYENLKEYFSNTLLGFFNDESGFHNNSKMSYITDTGTAFAYYPWGNQIAEEFKEIYKDEWLKSLCGLWYDFDNNQSADFRIKYMDLITKEYYKNYSSRLAKWCHNHGIKFIGHILEDAHAHAKTGYGCGHFFRAIGDQDMSGIDVVLHQLIPGMTQCAHRTCSSNFPHANNEFYHYYMAKLGASFGHADPRKNGQTVCEIFGAYGYAEGTRMMKYIADHMLVRGINYFIPASFSPSEDGFDIPPLFYNNGKNPLYSYKRSIFDYMNRVAYLLNDGIHISSCAIFYDAHAIWANGTHLPGEKVAKALYDNNFDYDILPIEYIEKIDEKGYLNGEKFELILVPYAEYLPKEVIEKLKKCNAEVVCVGTENLISYDFSTVNLKDLPEFMKGKGLTDIETDYSDVFLRSYHYVRNNAHMYMFTNEHIADIISANVKLSGFSGGDYAVYDAMENRAYRAVSEDGSINITIPPYGSIMIIIGEIDYEKLEYFTDKEIIKEQELECVYKLSLSRENGPYEYYRTVDKLFNVTGPCGDARFSGNMKYETVINITEDEGYILDLGTVGEAAEVAVNNVTAGRRISPPYSFDITDLIKNGENKLEITVSNHLAYSRRDRYSDFHLYEPSGLLGPVRVKMYKK